MRTTRWIVGIGLGALAAAGCAVAPAIGAPDLLVKRTLQASGFATGSRLGSFTPAAGDPKLAAYLARGAGQDGAGFHFTPADLRKGSHAVTVAVRTSVSQRGTAGQAYVDAATNVAPIAYNLGTSVGWKRFAIPNEAPHVVQPVPTATLDGEGTTTYSVPHTPNRVKGTAEKPTGTARLTEGPGYSTDVGGSYSLTRNFDVTAGVRYKAERVDRLDTMPDNRRDNQSVYIGTAFRF